MGPHFQTQKRTARILAGMLVGICVVGAIAITLLQVRVAAKRKIATTLQSLEVRDDFPVRVGSWRLGLTSAKFENISVGKSGDLLISEITADVEWNPFASGFGRLHTVRFDRIQLRLVDTNVSRMIQSTLAKFSTATKTTDSGEGKSRGLFSRLPFDKRLKIRSGGIKVVDSFGRTRYVARGLSTLVDRDQKKVVFKLARVSTASGLQETGIEGRLNQSETGHYEFWVGKHMRKNRPWYIKGSYGGDELKLQADLRTMPSYLLPYVRDYVAKPKDIQSVTKLEASRQPAGWKFNFHTRATGVRIAHRAIADEVVGPFGMNFTSRGIWLPDEDLINVEQGNIAIFDRRTKQPTRLSFSGGTRVSRQDQKTELFGIVKLPETPCNALITAPPQQFAPMLKDFRVQGKMQFAVEVNVPLAHPADFYYKILDSKFDCEVDQSPYHFSKKHLSSGFHLTRAFDDRQIRISLNPQSDSYSPLSAIAQAVKTSFVTSEDASFWKHDGIDGHAVEAALRKNLAESKVVIGASTITMQTVKNLFLTHSRTFSRKYQEMILAWHLDRALDKERILEIYLNIIEFGPGIYGITRAAEHYFSKHPFDLTWSVLFPGRQLQRLHWSRGWIQFVV